LTDDNFRFETSQATEAAFYAAFEAMDLRAMMSTWLDSPQTMCIHPMRSRLTGVSAVEDSWREIFAAGGSQMRFTLTQPMYITGESVSTHCLFEDIRFGENFSERARMLATNTYVLTDDGWRMQSHHGSPVPPTATPTHAPAPATVH
jgi:ketosteroid isomerase-like protein